MYRYVLFDLDGTLTDSGEGITNCVRYALDKLGIQETDPDRLNLFVGPPLVDSFRQYYGMDEEQALLAVRYYRERYAPVGIFENRVYDGIPELLHRLKSQGRSLMVASSKPERYVRVVLEKFELARYFDEVVGASMDERSAQKPLILREVLRRSGITENERPGMVMIGDRRYDVEGARSIGIDSIGVNYGYARPGEIQAAGATWAVQTVAELSALFDRV